MLDRVEVSSSEKHGGDGLPQLCRTASRPSDTQTALQQRAIGSWDAKSLWYVESIAF